MDDLDVQVDGLRDGFEYFIREFVEVVEDYRGIGLEVSGQFDLSSLSVALTVERVEYGPSQTWQFNNLPGVIDLCESINAEIESTAFWALVSSGLGPIYIKRKGDQFEYELWADKEDRDTQEIDIGELVDSVTGQPIILSTCESE